MHTRNDEILGSDDRLTPRKILAPGDSLARNVPLTSSGGFGTLKSMIPIDPKTATEEDLKSLVENGVEENRQLEFKRDLPGPDYEAKKEFLADVSSFANAVGGLLVFGIEDEEGVAKEVVGFQVDDLDSAVLRLENLLRDGVEPRLSGVEMVSVELSDDRYALLIAVSRSWMAPHVVRFQKHWRFYSRTSRGKYPLDVHEVKNSVLFSGSIGDHLTQFRQERLGRIVADDIPIPLLGEARLVLHVVHFGAFSPGFSLDVREVLEKKLKPWPLHHRSAGFNVNIDGLVAFSSSAITGEEKYTYVQLFRSGILEIVDGDLLSYDLKETRVIPINRIEKILLEHLPNYLNLLAKAKIGFPVAVMLSLLRVKGYLAYKDQDSTMVSPRFIDRNDLILPELVLESLPEDLPSAIRPMLDVLWNAGGYTGSPNYDDEGNWSPGV